MKPDPRIEFAMLHLTTAAMHVVGSRMSLETITAENGGTSGSTTFENQFVETVHNIAGAIFDDLQDKGYFQP